VGETVGGSDAVLERTAALDLPSARILAGQASIIQDLQFVMDCCKRLLSELSAPEADRDGVVPQALWLAALVAYARCFGGGRDCGLTLEDVRNLPLQGAVLKFHEWVIGERRRLTEPPADPFETAKIGAALSPAGQPEGVHGIAVFATSRVLIDATGVQQLGALAAELAKQTALAAQSQQQRVLADARQMDMARLYASPRLGAA
jgi:hypothetical protein